MNTGYRVGLLAGFATAAAVVGVVATTGAALKDNYDTPRLSSFNASCDDPPVASEATCVVEAVIVRPLTEAAKTDAATEGLEATPIRERLMRKRYPRGALTTWLRNNGTVVP